MDPKIWHDLFHPDISIIEKIIRPVIVYFFLVIALKLAGKRELAQLNNFDLVVLLTLSNTVQNAIIGNDNSLLGGVVGAATLLFLNALVVTFLFKHPRLNRKFEGDPDVLIEGGKLKHDRLTKERLTVSELEAAAHKQGFSSLEQVDRAILEPGGIFSFTGKEPTPESERHSALVGRLDQIARELAELRAFVTAKG